MALAVLAFREGGAVAVGVVSLLRMVPAAILSPVLTAVADRVPRDRVLVAVSLGVGLGAVLTPGLIAVLDGRGALVVTGLVLPLLAGLCWRRLAELDRRLGGRDDEIDVLRMVPMLRALPVPSIEHLAARAHRRRYAAGAAVFDQGDDGHAFYVIVDGRAEVVGDGALVGSMGPGESFGEIALLGATPRTAGVRAAPTWSCSRSTAAPSSTPSPATTRAVTRRRP